ncbi:MAG TPA: hypothetical protein VHB18_11080 [Mycobacteriales bacterium]|nr:hypothetical protein [Mycobacteriales bacterium]
MISTFTSARGTRWAGGVLIAAASALSIGVLGPIESAAAATPTVVTISPSAVTIASGGCAALTVHATPAGVSTITLQATETAAANPSPLSICTPSGGDTASQLANGVSGGSAGLPPIIPPTDGTATLRMKVDTDANGFATVGVSSSLAGSVSVVAYYNNGANAAPSASNPKSSATTVTVVQGGADAVSSLTVSPTSSTQYVGSGVTYTVTTVGEGGVPISGIEVDYVMSGVDTQVPVHQCGVHTDSNGVATCTITNGGAAGTDTITFYVNASGGSSGPDSGEPQATATATFAALPGGGPVTIAATCSNTRLSGPATTPVVETCTNSTATHNVTFTATVKNTSTQAPVSGVVVSWNRSGTVGDSTLSAQNCTTNASGVCSITLTEPAPFNGLVRSLVASVGSTNATPTPVSAGWESPAPTRLTVNPPLQTTSNGGTSAFTAHVLDQFGADYATAQGISWLVTAGRNAGKSGTATTGANGASFGFTDTAPSSGTTTDTVQIKDTTTTSIAPVNATVNYIAGSTQAGLLALDVSGNCDVAAPASTNSSAVGANSIKVCVLVTNSSGTKLPGKPVTIAVSIGRVDTAASPGSNPSPSVTVDADGNGVATAWVSSTTAGTQNITATADSKVAGATVTYSTSVANLKTVKIAPATTEVAPGASQSFTATAQDANGNPISGASLLFVVNGPGTIDGGSNQLLLTGANGTASVVLNTTSADNGAGSVTVSVQNDINTQCHVTGGACSAVASYTVKVGAKSAALLLFPQKNVTAGNGSAEGVEAVALNSDGSPAPNILVRFTVTGANSATGSATTTSSGAVIFAYDAVNDGIDTIAAYEDLNNNSVKDPGEPAATTNATIFPAGSHPGATKEHPSLVVSQKRANSHQEKLTLNVTSHPRLARATVTFYQVKKGVRHKIGNGTTGSKGKVKGTLKAGHGLTLKFQVKVKGKAGVKSGYSKVVKVHVK